MKLRRHQSPSAEVLKAAMAVPKQLKPKKRKNMDGNLLGDSLGRIHMQPQDIDRLQTRKVKALKKPKVAKD